MTHAGSPSQFGRSQAGGPWQRASTSPSPSEKQWWDSAGRLRGGRLGQERHHCQQRALLGAPGWAGRAGRWQVNRLGTET